VAAVAGVALLWLFSVVASALPPRADVLVLVPVLLLAGGITRIARGVLDLRAPRHVDGEVLRARTTGSEDSPRHWIAVDEGNADVVTAWRLPASLARKASIGDVVRLTVGRQYGRCRPSTS
jgi:hypothetical protein